MQPNPISPARALRQLIGAAGTLAVPGGGTPIEALSASAAGFEAFYVSGYAVAAWRHGLPDVGLTGLGDVAAAVGAITAVTALPVLVDADTGYGDVASVATTVARLERAGAAAVQIEDQVWPKRCGHMTGKQVIPADAMARKVAAAVATRADPDTVIVARTDALGPLGLAEAIERGKRYAGVGADAVFVDAPESVSDLEAIAASIDCPLIVNLTESGRTPILALDRLSELGFAVAIFPTAALRLAGSVFADLFSRLAASGATSAHADAMMSLDQMNDLLGLRRLQDLEASMLES